MRAGSFPWVVLLFSVTCPPLAFGQQLHDGFRDPVLVESGACELPFIAEVRDKLANRFALVSWKPEAPVGPERLRAPAGERPEYAAL